MSDILTNGLGDIEQFFQSMRQLSHVADFSSISVLGNKYFPALILLLDMDEARAGSYWSCYMSVLESNFVSC